MPTEEDGYSDFSEFPFGAKLRAIGGFIFSTLGIFLSLILATEYLVRWF